MWLGDTMDVPTYDLGSIISLVHSMKLLVITTDKDLNFTEHTADVHVRSTQSQQSDTWS